MQLTILASSAETPVTPFLPACAVLIILNVWMFFLWLTAREKVVGLKEDLDRANAFGLEQQQLYFNIGQQALCLVHDFIMEHPPGDRVEVYEASPGSLELTVSIKPLAKVSVSSADKFQPVDLTMCRAPFERVWCQIDYAHYRHQKGMPLSPSVRATVAVLGARAALNAADGFDAEQARKGM